ncbi:hypothetical protein ABID23_000665 [Bartonella silvatica]|uniref:BepF protein n=1 Tax=Bartonella silvatica TaxID=357760 RepID=A0ABV2HGA2_9HYPH
MKKSPPSSFVARMIAEFEKQNEQSPAMSVNKNTTAEKSANIKVAPPVPLRTKNQDQSNTHAQQSQGANPKVAPPVPPRTKIQNQNNIHNQQSQGTNPKVAPPVPPRTKIQNQNNAHTQQSQGTNPKVAPPVPLRTKNQDQSNTHAQQSQGTNPKVAPPVPLRTKNQDQSNTHAQQNPKVTSPQRPPRIKDQELKNAPLREAAISQTVLSLSTETVFLSEDEINRKVENNELVQVCKDQVRHYCKIVYGNANIFNEKLAEIERNPMLGYNFIWQVAATPKTMAPLTGKKTLGIKNKERKNAEEKVPDLALAVENFTHVVKQVKDGIDKRQKSEQTLPRGTLDLKQMAEVLKKPRTPEQQWAPLSDKELTQRVVSDTMVQYCHSEITYWCTTVYKNPNILQERLKDIQKIPEMSEELAWQVTTHPGFFGKLAGHNFHGFKNAARKLAENGLAPLSEAIEGYAEAVKQAKENILETHQAKQKHHEASLGQAQGLSKQQTLKSPKLSEHTPSNMHHETGETSRQAENRSHNTRSQKVETSKASALAI